MISISNPKGRRPSNRRPFFRAPPSSPHTNPLAHSKPQPHDPPKCPLRPPLETKQAIQKQDPSRGTGVPPVSPPHSSALTTRRLNYQLQIIKPNIFQMNLDISKVLGYYSKPHRPRSRAYALPAAQLHHYHIWYRTPLPPQDRSHPAQNVASLAFLPRKPNKTALFMASLLGILTPPVAFLPAPHPCLFCRLQRLNLP